MEEHLKTLRFAHRLILIFAGSQLLFSLSPDPAFRYERSRAELIGLQEYDYDRFVADTIREWTWAIEGEPNCSDNEPYELDKQDFFRSLVNGGSPDFSRSMILFPIPDSSESTVQQHFSFLENDVFFDYCITTNSIVDTINRYQGELKNEGLADRRLTRIELDFRYDEFQQTDQADAVLYRINYASLLERGFELPTHDVEYAALLRYFDDQSQLFQLTLTLQEGDFLTQPMLPLIESPSLGITQTNTALNQIEGDPPSAAEALPFSFAILDEIEDKPIDDAIRYLDRKIIEEKSHPTLYGVKIDFQNAFVVIPIVGLALYVFLFVHSLGTLHVADHLPDDLQFPSLLFYRRPGLKPVRFLSIVLPLLPFQVFLIRRGSPFSISGVVAEVISLLTAIVAYLSYRVVESFPISEKPESLKVGTEEHVTLDEASSETANLCRGQTSSGRSCSRRVAPGKKYCWQHSGPRE